MKKIYLSQAISRIATTHLEFPMGDPYGGPAYGEYRMGGVAAAVIGFVEAMSVAEVVMYAGIALNVVGTITGNQTLSQIGSVMSLAGGVMNLTGVGTTSNLMGEELVMNEAGKQVTASSMANQWQQADTAAQLGKESVTLGTEATALPAGETAAGATAANAAPAAAEVVPNAPAVTPVAADTYTLPSNINAPAFEAPPASSVVNDVVSPSGPAETFNLNDANQVVDGTKKLGVSDSFLKFMDNRGTAALVGAGAQLLRKDTDAQKATAAATMMNAETNQGILALKQQELANGSAVPSLNGGLISSVQNVQPTSSPTWLRPNLARTA